MTQLFVRRINLESILGSVEFILIVNALLKHYIYSIGNRMLLSFTFFCNSRITKITQEEKN